jgi:predicted metal-dependent TIM-barrel fold hydrolase
VPNIPSFRVEESVHIIIIITLIYSYTVLQTNTIVSYGSQTSDLLSVPSTVFKIQKRGNEMERERNLETNLLINAKLGE